MSAGFLVNHLYVKARIEFSIRVNIRPRSPSRPLNKWVLNQKSGDFTPKMDGWKFNGKPYEQMDDLGVPLFLATPKWP